MTVMHNPARLLAVPAILLGLIATLPVEAMPLTRSASLDGAAPLLVAGASGEANANTTKSSESKPAEAKEPKPPLTQRQKRERAALEQRRLLQEKATRARIQRNQQNLDTLRDEQAERLRLQQQTQRRIMEQQRQLARPQQPTQAPRLTPLDPPLMDQTHPRCGVPGMPLC